MVFEEEFDSFQTYAEVFPSNCIFLVDTYNTIEGVEKAIKVGKWLKEQGKHMLGVRLDSGDLAFLSIKTRELLDAAGLEDAKIVASNELDEYVVSELKQQGAKIDVWGVGTNLVTAKDHPALDGVYKLSAVRDPGGEWRYKLKLSEQMTKITNPGILQIRRFYNDAENVADAIYDTHSDISGGCEIIDPFDPTRRKHLTGDLQSRDLLVPIFREGECVYQTPSLPDIRENTRRELSHFHAGIKRFLNPHQYIVGMEKTLYDLKVDLIRKIRERMEP